MSQDRDSLLENAEVNPSTSVDYYDHIDTHPVQVPRDRAVVPPAKLPQIWAAFAATFSALSAGMVLGWTSPILHCLTNGKYNDIPVDKYQLGWIGSFATLGAMAMCVPTGFICDLIGRKYALMLLIVPFTGGWALIIWAKSVLALYFGRIITGMAVGACCVAAPLYNGEISHQNIRGALGSLFQLMIVTGIFLSYLFGEYLTPSQFTKLCASAPVLFLIIFAFQPETPSFLIKKGDHEGARRSLAKLRGANYDVDSELTHIEGTLKENAEMVTSLRRTFHQKPILKAVLISFALMFFQQFSGINVVILYASDIFQSTGINLNSNVATIVVGAMQTLSTLCASLIIEKTGRKRLIILSLSVVAINITILGIYFSIKTRGHPDSDVLSDIGFIPIGTVCLFVVAFSLGLGPIPWMIASEILPTEIRGMVGSAAGTFNWFLAFVITKSYLGLATVLGYDSIFYIFSLISVVGTIFIIVLLPETKGKTVAEIQQELNQ
ncbi:facilitated trehalose transporter Tret1-2 homolog isoform X1 [Euwallacea similis]|uniref:facilitated trehalose transporter Tret1-2 homolog isoform X1 n=2 Tax=Euwallacea similis TaxID=1736056 RepID=UPI00344E2336